MGRFLRYKLIFWAKMGFAICFFLAFFLLLPGGRAAAAAGGTAEAGPSRPPGHGGEVGGSGAVFFGEAQRGERVRLFTLERARMLARREGTLLERVEIERELAESRLAMARRSVGVGSYYDSRAMKGDMEALEKHMASMEETIGELELNIRLWRAQQEDEERDEAERARLEEQVSRAYQEIGELNENLLEIRKAYASLVPRYYQTKALEDAARPTLEPLELARDAAADEAAVQPELLDYQVESLFLSLLAADGRREYQQALLENRRSMVRREELLLELGLSTPLRLAQAEVAVEQVAVSLEAQLAELAGLRRDFARLLGLPLDGSFALVPPAPHVLDTGELRLQLINAPEPDLRKSPSYRRALEVLRRRQDELKDTGQGDGQKYRQAELNVEKARLELEQALQSLQMAYLNVKGQRELAEKSLENADRLLAHAEETLARAELQYRLGLISRAELERQGIARREAEVNYQAAWNRRYLAYRAYQLARSGIPPSPAQF